MPPSLFLDTHKERMTAICVMTYFPGDLSGFRREVAGGAIGDLPSLIQVTIEALGPHSHMGNLPGLYASDRWAQRQMLVEQWMCTVP